MMINNDIIKNTTIKSIIYFILIIYTFTILYPLFLMIITSLKTTSEIFTSPFSLPKKLNIGNYIKLFTITNYAVYFRNSIIVAILSILFVVVLSSLAANVLAKYEFIGNKFLYLLFIAGLIIPIRLGTISILKIMIFLHLNDNILSVILINIAVGIPFGVFVLTDFIRMIPGELSDSARIDGCSEMSIFFRITTPLLRPALAAVAIVNFIPVWNDFWFPLVLLKKDVMKTVPLATALLFGQYQTNYALVFAVLTLASLPVIIFYLILSKHFIKGLSSGALKG